MEKKFDFLHFKTHFWIELEMIRFHFAQEQFAVNYGEINCNSDPHNSGQQLHHATCMVFIGEIVKQLNIQSPGAYLGTYKRYF